jgi:hypothetical protein
VAGVLTKVRIGEEVFPAAELSGSDVELDGRRPLGAGLHGVRVGSKERLCRPTVGKSAVGSG